MKLFTHTRCVDVSRLLGIIVIIGLALTACGGRQAAGPASTPTPSLPEVVSPAPSPAASPTGAAEATPTPSAGTPSPATPVAEATPSPSPQAGVASPTGPGGPRVEAVLTRAVTERSEPAAPATEFPEDAEKIFLAVKSDRADTARIEAKWLAVNAEGYDPNQKINETQVSLDTGERGAMWVGPPQGGFLPGDYRVDLTVNGEPAPALPFKIVPILPMAALVAEAGAPAGFNIALAALGGKVESATSQYNDGQLAATNLIDGFGYVRTGQSCSTTCGWSSRDRTVPQEIVLSFHKSREALINAVLINSATWETIQRFDRLAKHVEIWASTSSPTEGFTKVAGARLRRLPTEQVITFPPTRARYVKIRFLSNHGGPYTQAGDIKIIEAREGESILRDAPKNLALPALGGAIARYSSRTSRDLAGYLVDGGTVTDGWRSDDGPYGPESYLPQEIVFAFRGDQAAVIDRLVLNPKSGYDPATWPSVVTVSVSSENPFEGFEEVGQFTVPQRAGDQSFPIGRRARFVKLRILKNHGGRYTTLGEVKVFEGSASGYQSILLSTPPAAGSGTGAATPQINESGIAVETEPNNTAAEANRLDLGRRIRGAIDPLGELDHFRLTLTGTSPSVVTFDLLGRPYVRTSLALTDPAGKTLAVFDPGRLPVQQTAFSLRMQPGDHLVRVTEPPISLVLIWDTSGSMDKASVQNLEQAVGAYLDQVRPSERMNLIRFSGESRQSDPTPVEVLLPGFTSDRGRLKAAAQGKFFSKGGTPFYDAVAKGIDLLANVKGNRAIVVMTDGEDTTSRISHAGFWRLLEDKRIRLYTIGLGPELQAYVPGIGSSGARVLTHAALATNGRFFFARTPEELRGFYQQIADELRTVSTYYLRAIRSAGPGTLAVSATGERIASVSAPSQIELILDVSGSMKRRIEGREMMDIAKDVMGQIIKGLPDDARVALRFYGHRIREGRAGDCQDSELVVPFGRIDKPRMLARVRGVKALGTTPIAYTLRQVPRDFGSAAGEKLIILVTDGKEECGGSPSAVVSEVVAKGIKIRLNIVGFALAEAAVRAEMERVAKITGGRFFDAQNAQALRTAIQRSLSVPYDVHDAAGARIAGGLTGEDSIKVPEGIYTVTVRAAGTPVVVPGVRVRYNGFTKVALKKEGQQIGIRIVGP